jgi:hypothetical protein
VKKHQIGRCLFDELRRRIWDAEMATVFIVSIDLATPSEAAKNDGSERHQKDGEHQAELKRWLGWLFVDARHLTRPSIKNVA